MIGETFNVKQANWISEGASGSNVTWDHSNLQETGVSITIDHSNGIGLFPLTNITQETSASGQQNEAYIETNSTGQFIHGIDAGGILITYQDPVKVMAFTLNNSVSETDFFSATFTSGSFSFTRSGSSQLVADGYGTLITPEGTFTDVIRVRNEMAYTDSYSGGTIEYLSITHSWFKAGVHYALASVSEISTNIGAPTQYSAQYLTNISLGLKDQSQEVVSVFPNPTNGLISIKMENYEKARILNSLGQEVLRSNSSSLDLGILSRGIYLLITEDKNGNLYSERVIKE